MLTMPDFEACAAHPRTGVCDATLASPLRLRPLELGCDVSLHSATKVLGGHDDLLAGVAAVERRRPLRSPPPHPPAHRPRRVGRHGVAARAGAADARGAVRPDGSDRARARRPPRRPPRRHRSTRYPGFGFLDLLRRRRRRRGREARRDRDDDDRERDEPRRHPHEARVAAPLGGRALPGRTAPTVGRRSSRPTCCGRTSSGRSRAP